MVDQLNRDRLPIRMIGGFVVLYVAILAANLILGVCPNMIMKWLSVTPDVRAYVGGTFSYGLRLAAYIVIPALALRKVLGLDSWPRFYPACGHGWRDLLYGFGLVAGVLTVLFVIEVNAGWLVVDGWNWQVMPADAWLRTAWVGFLVNLGVAVGEEAIFRGYLLTGLDAVWGWWRALSIMMIVFGSFHLIAYSEGGLQSGTLALAILLATLFGGLLGLVYLRTGSLWVPVILHFAWNFVESDLLNLSGDLTNPNLIGALTHLAGPLSLTEVVPENVVVLESLAFGVISIGLWLWLRHGRREEVVREDST